MGNLPLVSVVPDYNKALKYGAQRDDRQFVILKQVFDNIKLKTYFKLLYDYLCRLVARMRARVEILLVYFYMY